MERLRLTRFDLPLFWMLLDWSMSRFVDLELLREISPGHVLQGRQFQAIAYRVGSDDFLFQLDEGVADVHLTFMKEHRCEFPSTKLYATLQDWAAAVKADDLRCATT
jgi:hypothetical protein